VKLGRDAPEGVVELGAKAIDGRDNRDRNARRDEAVLNCGSARTIFQETQNKLFS